MKGEGSEKRVLWRERGVEGGFCGGCNRMRARAGS